MSLHSYYQLQLNLFKSNLKDNKKKLSYQELHKICHTTKIPKAKQPGTVCKHVFKYFKYYNKIQHSRCKQIKL